MHVRLRTEDIDVDGAVFFYVLARSASGSFCFGFLHKLRPWVDCDCGRKVCTYIAWDWLWGTYGRIGIGPSDCCVRAFMSAVAGRGGEGRGGEGRGGEGRGGDRL